MSVLETVVERLNVKRSRATGQPYSRPLNETEQHRVSQDRERMRALGIV